MNHAFQYLKFSKFGPSVNRFVANEGKKKFNINVAKNRIHKINIRKFSTYSHNKSPIPPPNNNMILIYAIICGSGYKFMYELNKHKK
jgi:hypothetical protein